jgi:hypothetical protein
LSQTRGPPRLWLREYASRCGWEITAQEPQGVNQHCTLLSFWIDPLLVQDCFVGFIKEKDWISLLRHGWLP